MTAEISYRRSLEADRPGLEKLYSAAFPDEDLLPLVRELLLDPALALSLVAVIADEICGHVSFTACSLEGEESYKIALLAPLAVLPARQKAGIGSALVRTGHRLLAKDGVNEVLVLGDPGYYGRFGFTPSQRIEPPYPVPDDWRSGWQSLILADSATLPSGRLVVPEPWRRRELWVPTG